MAERPAAGPPSIGADGEVEILRDLLQVERERLAVALKIEEERKIVFPETTVIIKDIERLLDKVRAKESPEVVQQDRDLDALLAGLDG